MRGGALLAFALAGAGCSRALPIPDRDLALSVTAVEETPLGRAFDLTVERSWNALLTPEPWRDELLAPLRVVPLAVDRRDDGVHVAERRRFRAYAFVAGRLTLPPIALHATDAHGRVRSIASAPLSIEVRTAAPPGSELEGPEGPLFPAQAARDHDRFLISVLILAAAAVAALLLLRHRRAAPPPAAAPAAEPPARRALARLAALRATGADDAAADDRFHVEAAALLKEFVADRFALPVLERTTEEIAAEPAASLPRSTELVRLLGRCDRVKFSAARSDAGARSELLDASARFVEESA
jgi:hypothetical protein